MTKREKAVERLIETKRRMDEAQRVLDLAEAQWHEACVELDRLDNEPTALVGEK